MEKIKEKIRNSFSRSACNYNQSAELQGLMADKIFSFVEKGHKKILDIGCGTGSLVQRIAESRPKTKIVGVDIAPGMIEIALTNSNKNAKYMLADGEALPFRAAEFDLVVSSAALQWMDPKCAIAEASRVLTRNGKYYFATFGPETMVELKKAGFSINDFPSIGDLYKILKNHFKKLKMESDCRMKNYKDIYELFSYLRRIGAQIPKRVKNKGLMTKNKINSLFKNSELAVSFEIIYGVCEKE